MLYYACTHICTQLIEWWDSANPMLNFSISAHLRNYCYASLHRHKARLSLVYMHISKNALKCRLFALCLNGHIYSLSRLHYVHRCASHRLVCMRYVRCVDVCTCVPMPSLSWHRFASLFTVSSCRCDGGGPP